MGQTTLNWDFNGSDPDEFRVYRADAPMDPEALPAPLATVAGDLREYVDTTVVTDSTYYYRVSAVQGSVERVSTEIEHTAELTGDPLWAAVKSLLHCDGVEGATNLVDETGLAWNSPNLAAFSDDQSKFGGSSWRGTDKQDSRIQTTDVALIRTNQTFFTIEGWMYVEELSTYLGAPLFSQSCSGGTCEEGVMVDVNGAIGFYRGSAHSGGALSVFSANGAFTLNVWHHVAVTFDGTYIRVFLDGVLVATSAAQTSGGWYDTGNPQYLGHVIVPGYPQYRGSIKGFIDEFRLTNDCRYLTDFEVQTIPHQSTRQLNSFVDTFDADNIANGYIKCAVGNSNATWTVSGGQLSGAGGNQALLSPQGVYIEDGYVEVDMTQSEDGGVAFRLNSKNDYYVFIMRDASAASNANTCSMYKCVNGVFTALGALNVTLGTWTRGTPTTFRVEFTGSNIEVKRDGSTIMSRTDTAHARGRVGVRNFSATASIYQRLAAGG